MILYRYREWNSSETNWDESIRYVNPRIQSYTCISGLCSRLMKKLCSTKKKKGCFEGNEARLFISCQGRSSRKWRCCMHRVYVAFNAVFRPLDFNEAAIFEYIAFDIISHLDYLLFSFHHWKARLNKWYEIHRSIFNFVLHGTFGTREKSIAITNSSDEWNVVGEYL